MKRNRHRASSGLVEHTRRRWPLLALVGGFSLRHWRWARKRWQLAAVLAAAALVGTASRELAGREWSGSDGFQVSAHELEALLQDPPALPLEAADAAVALRIAESNDRVSAEREKDAALGTRFSPRSALPEPELFGAVFKEESLRTEPLALAPLPELDALRAQLRGALP